MSADLQHTVRTFTTKETAVEVRRALKAEFPGVKFSVVMDRGTAHGWFSVSWTDGPMTEAVDRVCDGFLSERFNSMTDGYDRVEPTLYADADGSLYEPRYSCCGILTHRRLSPEATAWASVHAVAGSRWWNDWESPQMHEPEYYARQALLAGVDLREGFPERPGDVWADRWHR